MAYTWRFYLLVAHLTDEKNHTACNRQLPQSDDAICVPEERKCKTCQKYALKFKEVLCPMLEGYVLATRCKGCTREATCKPVLKNISQEGGKTK